MQDDKEFKKKKRVKKSSEDTPTGKNGATRKTYKRKSKTLNNDNNLEADNKVNKFNVIQNWCCCLCQVEFQIEEEKPIVCDRCEYPVCITCSQVPPLNSQSSQELTDQAFGVAGAVKNLLSLLSKMTV